MCKDVMTTHLHTSIGPKLYLPALILVQILPLKKSISQCCILCLILTTFSYLPSSERYPPPYHSLTTFQWEIPSPTIPLRTFQWEVPKCWASSIHQVLGVTMHHHSIVNVLDTPLLCHQLQITICNQYTEQLMPYWECSIGTHTPFSLHFEHCVVRDGKFIVCFCGLFQCTPTARINHKFPVKHHAMLKWSEKGCMYLYMYSGTPKCGHVWDQ